MRHVRGYLYATSSPHDGILRTLVVNADGGSGPPAGQVGFRLPAQARKATRTAYQRVINLPWKASYVAYDWKGGHTGVAGSKFVKSVIAPRLIGAGPFPLDRPLTVGASGGVIDLEKNLDRAKSPRWDGAAVHGLPGRWL